MKALLLIVLAICCCQALFSQDTVLKKNYYLKARIWEPNQTTRDFYVADVNDTALLLVNDPVKFRQGGLTANALSYQNMDVILLKRKGSVGRGLWKGAVLGAILGGITGAVTYKKCEDCFFDFGIGTDIAAGAIAGTGVGAVFGAFFGAISSKRFTIGGNKDKFEKMRLSVLDMAYRKTN
jgi:hypothetical protein